MTPTEYDWAYLSGLFDGEGCIKVIWRKLKHRKHQWQMNLDISNTHRGVIIWVKETFGGSAVSEERKGPNQRRRFHWYSEYDIRALAILEGIYPYLKIKKLQAEIAMKFLRTSHGRSGKGIPLSKEELTLRDRTARLLIRSRWKEWPPIPKFKRTTARCAGCNEQFTKKTKDHTYCSSRCSSRILARKVRAKRKSLGLTTGGTMPKRTIAG